MQRRALLTTGMTVGTAVFAGCLSDDGDDTASTPEPTPADSSVAMQIAPAELDGYVRPAGDPEITLDPLECGYDEYEREPAHLSFDWGETNAHDVADDGYSVALRTDRTAVEYGETIAFELTNLTDDSISTGNFSKHSLMVKTTEGWEDVRVWTPVDDDGTARRQQLDDAAWREPGTITTWEFGVTETGLVESHVGEEHLEVCPDLSTGRYAFVYWGLMGETPVGVAFDLTDA